MSGSSRKRALSSDASVSMASTATPVSRRASRETASRGAVSQTTGRDKKNRMSSVSGAVPSTPSGSTPPGSGPFRNCGCRTVCSGQEVKRIVSKSEPLKGSDSADSLRRVSWNRPFRHRMVHQVSIGASLANRRDAASPLGSVSPSISSRESGPSAVVRRARDAAKATRKPSRAARRSPRDGAAAPSPPRAAYHSSSASHASGGVRIPATFRALLISSPLLGRHSSSGAPSSTSMASSVASWSYLESVLGKRSSSSHSRCTCANDAKVAAAVARSNRRFEDDASGSSSESESEEEEESEVSESGASPPGVERSADARGASSASAASAAGVAAVADSAARAASRRARFAFLASAFASRARSFAVFSRHASRRRRFFLRLARDALSTFFSASSASSASSGRLASCLDASLADRGSRRGRNVVRGISFSATAGHASCVAETSARDKHPALGMDMSRFVA